MSSSLAKQVDALFPYEHSLENADVIRLELCNTLLTIRQTEANLRNGLQPSDVSVHALQEKLTELLDHVQYLRAAADESNEVVSNITSHMANIDRAKRNLELTLTTFRRISMLSSSLRRLRHIFPTDITTATPEHFKDAANVIEAATQLDAALKPYRSIPDVSRLSAYVAESSQRLRDLVFARFQALFNFNQPISVDSLELLQSAAGLLDALGVEARRLVLDWYTKGSLADHRRIFRVQDEAGHLDNLPRRLASFKKILKAYTDLGHSLVFPEHWNVLHIVVASFNNSTRDDLSTLLAQSTRSESFNLDLLYDSLNLTRDFETQVSKSLSAESYLGLLKSAASDPILIRSTEPMSSAFQPHLGLYVRAQAKLLGELFSDFQKDSSKQQRIQPNKQQQQRQQEQQEQQNDNDDIEELIPDDLDIFPSSAQLFHFYQKTLDRCAKLSTSTPLYDLSILFKHFLQRYAYELLSPTTVAPKFLPFTNNQQQQQSINPQDISSFALALNTANYCAETTDQLQAKLRKTIDNDLVEQIEFEKEKEMFMACSARAILCLLRLLEHSVVPCLNGMSQALEKSLPSRPTNDDDSDNEDFNRKPSIYNNVPIEPSEYLQPLLSCIRSFASFVKGNIEHRTSLRSIFDKLVTLVITAFATQLVKSRPIGSTGSDQLLLDVQSLRACLSTLPEIIPVSDHAPSHSSFASNTDVIPASYSRHVNRSIAQLETILKILRTPSVPHGEFVNTFLEMTRSQSFSDFQKIIDLKGIGKSDQNNLLDIFLEKSNEEKNTVSNRLGGSGGANISSLLSTLDMDATNSLAPSSLLPSLPVLPTVSSLSSLQQKNKDDRSSNNKRSSTPKINVLPQKQQQQQQQQQQKDSRSNTPTVDSTSKGSLTTRSNENYNDDASPRSGSPRSSNSLPLASAKNTATNQSNNYIIDDNASTTTASGEHDDGASATSSKRIDQFRKAFTFRSTRFWGASSGTDGNP